MWTLNRIESWRCKQDTEVSSSNSAGGEGTAEVPNAKAELAGQTTDEYMAVQRSEFPAVDTIEGSCEAGALPDAVENSSNW